jgi:antitoxin ParD1/3/4/toxin ParE1/3/4
MPSKRRAKLDDSYLLAPAAQRDLRALQAYIAQENSQAARRVLAEIRAACARLADNPHLGHAREDLPDQPVRFWSVRTYSIIYRPETHPLEIVRIVHGARDIPHLL